MIIARTQFGEADVLLINHDPELVGTDAFKNSLLINNDWYKKLDDGKTTNVCKMSFMDIIGVYTKQQNSVRAILTSGTTIAWNLDDEQSAKLILAHDATLSNAINIKDGGTYVLLVQQDPTGGRTLAFDDAYIFPDDTVIEVTSGADTRTLYGFLGDGDELISTGVKGYAALIPSPSPSPSPSP